MAATWDGAPSIKGPTDSVRMILLTICLTGVQLVWSVEMSYCAPYLLSLGLTKSLMSLVWIVGPLAGLTQPVVGAIADRSRSRWGRRRPLMVIGSVVVAVALLILGWTREISTFFFGEGDATNTIVIILAIMALALVDFAVNAVQACCRALIVDTLPIPQQQHGSAWASRMIAVGNIAGYFAGTVDLKAIFGTSLGDSQFKQLMGLAAFWLLFCILVTCFCVDERVLLNRRSSDEKSSTIQVFVLIWRTSWHLPKGIWDMCVVLFWAWIGWFPFMVYSTTFVGEVLKRYDVAAQESLQSSADVVGDIARVGSMALVMFSVVSLFSSVLLPWVVTSPESDEFRQKDPGNGSLANFLEAMIPFKPSLATAWICGHIMYASLMLMTLFVSTVNLAMLCVALSGVAWSLMTWAPFSIVGEEINRLNICGPTNSYRPRRLSGAYGPLNHQRNFEYDEDVEMEEATGNPIPSDATQTTVNAEAGSDELAGVYLGILNVFACLPQFVGDVGPPRVGINAIAVCMGIGGISTLVAAHYTLRFKHR
ncbi:uncharacterized protein H6S33_001204 [Morchella sextelata]|uniref:uncharacterized protein n=1 Tax=Morchella sextelata TaxID=1174677 RepID=UPI001D04B757|nr:uncharacterized protein H6S33_001204 [Morchella sextelata]KAH0608976.1 hypothetical protein H6S33_001204 [Morchella sextelata]